MNATWITDLDHLVTCADDGSILAGQSILIEDGTITAIGPRADLAARATGLSAHRIDGRAHLALPGLVNLHTHTPMTLLRGIAEDVDLQGFLAGVWAAEAAVMDPASVELGARLGALESLLGGTTTALDMYFHHEAAYAGGRAVGLRHVIGPVFFDGPGPDGLSWQQRIDSLATWRRTVDEAIRAGAPTIPLAAMPHATYTNSPEHLAHLRAALAENGYTALTTHVSENATENQDITERYGHSPTQVLAGAGLLDGELAVTFGHGVHLDGHDRDVAATAGVTVAHCPGSNAKLASGALNWAMLAASGLRIGIGTDGASSSNDLDMWQVLRHTALLARLTSADPQTAPAWQVLRAATIDGARALGLGEVIGSLEVGKRADLILIDLDAPHLTPVHDVPALLVFAAGRADVATVLVDGQVVVDQRRSTRIDQSELLAAVRARAAVADRAVGR
ncbi:MAG: amidohydrolase family protein [Nostocoides sp.]